MSNELRDRIADVLLAHAENDAGPDCTCGWEWEGYGLWKDSYASHVADAVIADLGLVEEMGLIYGRNPDWRGEGK